MQKCPRDSRKKSKTRCFNDNDVVVHRTPGKCPKKSRKISKERCFDDNDNEITFTTDKKGKRHRIIILGDVQTLINEIESEIKKKKYVPPSHQKYLDDATCVTM